MAACQQCGGDVPGSSLVCPQCGRTDWEAIAAGLAVCAAIFAVTFALIPRGLWRLLPFGAGAWLTYFVLSEVVKSVSISRRTGPMTPAGEAASAAPEGDDLFRLLTEILLTLRLTYVAGTRETWLVGWLSEQKGLPGDQAEALGAAAFAAYVESDGDTDEYFGLCRQYLGGTGAPPNKRIEQNARR